MPRKLCPYCKQMYISTSAVKGMFYHQWLMHPKEFDKMVAGYEAISGFSSVELVKFLSPELRTVMCTYDALLRNIDTYQTFRKILEEKCVGN